jgi:hypothetical protein
MPSLAVLLDSSRIADSILHLSQMSGTNGPTRIKPWRVGFELRTFRGVNCDHVDKVVTRPVR